MSKWQEAGFPDRIRMSSPLKVAAALLAAVNERRAIWGLWPLETMKRFTPFSYYNPSGFYSNIDFAAVDDCDAWTVPELARDFSGKYPTWKTFTKDSLAEAIGEEIIEGKKELSPRFFAEWALQRYKILNLFYIHRGHTFGGTIGKFREVHTYEGFGEAVGELSSLEWGDGYYLTRGASTESSVYDGRLDNRLNVWRVQQNCCSWVDQIRAYTPQSVEHWGHVGRGVGSSGGYDPADEERYEIPEKTTVVDNGGGKTGTVTQIFDKFNTNLEFGKWNLLGKYELAAGETREINVFDALAISPPLPADPGAPDISNKETSREIIRGFYLDQIYAVHDYSPGLEYLDLP